MKINKYLTTMLSILLCLCFLPSIGAFASPQKTPSGVDVSQIEEVVDRIMDDKIGKDSPGASVSVVKDGEIVFSKGYGVSDIEKQTPVSPSDTVFEIGSVSKIFAWTAVMQLVEKGVLDLDTDIREYIGHDRLDLSFDEPITLRHLMNHTAGFEENASEMMTFDKSKLLPLEQWVSAKHQPKQIYKPGTVSAYSNFGTDIAGFIVQQKTGILYEEYVKEHIFAPLDMNLSTAYADYYHIDEIVKKKSKGYSASSNGFQLTPENFVNEAPAGTLTSTAEDMARFMIAQMNYDKKAPYQLFERSETMKDFHSDSLHLYDGMPSNAHGFWSRTENGVRLLEHGGNTTNFSALLSIVPEENFGICILTNVADEAAGIRTKIIEELSASFSHEATVSVPEVHSQDLSGTYYSGRRIESNFLSSVYLLAGDSLKITDLKDGTLKVQLPKANGGDILHYAEVSPLTFERTDSTPSMLEKQGGTLSHLKFTLDEEGNVSVVQTGNIRDYVKLPIVQNIFINQMLFLFFTAVFAIGSIALPVSAIANYRKKKKQLPLSLVPLSKLRKILPATGLLCVINIVICIIRFLAVKTAPIATFKIHLIINVIFLLIMLICSIRILFQFTSTQFTIKQKSWNAILILSTLLFTVWLINYGHLSFWKL